MKYVIYLWCVLAIVLVGDLIYDRGYNRKVQAQQATFISSWAFVPARDTFNVNPPLTGITLKNSIALDSTGIQICPVLVYAGNPTTGDSLVPPLTTIYTAIGNTITFLPNTAFNPVRPQLANATELQVLYCYSPTDTALAAGAAANAAQAQQVIANAPTGPTGQQ
jgi:hypothetical protein